MKLPEPPHKETRGKENIRELPPDSPEIRLRLQEALKPQTEEIINPEDRLKTPLLTAIGYACAPDKNILEVINDICVGCSNVFQRNGFQVNKRDVAKQLNILIYRYGHFEIVISDLDRFTQDLCIGLQLSGLLE